MNIYLKMTVTILLWIAVVSSVFLWMATIPGGILVLVFTYAVAIHLQELYKQL